MPLSLSMLFTLSLLTKFFLKNTNFIITCFYLFISHFQWWSHSFFLLWKRECHLICFGKLRLSLAFWYIQLKKPFRQIDDTNHPWHEWWIFNHYYVECPTSMSHFKQPNSKESLLKSCDLLLKVESFSAATQVRHIWMTQTTSSPIFSRT